MSASRRPIPQSELEPDRFLTVRVPAELDERLGHQAVREDRTKAALVRRAVALYLAEEEAAAAERAAR